MKKIFQPLCFVLLGIALSACSHDDEPTPSNAPLISLGSDATFTLTEEKFETSKPASRAMAAQTQPQEVDLGDGLRTTITIEEDSEPETRANPISQGRYSIYALDGSGNRITGTDKTLTGEVNASGTFVADTGSKLELPAGTYTFVCISEGVVDNGNSLVVVNSTKSPMLGKTTKTVSSADRHVSFTMKHLAARVRFKYIAYTESTNNVKVALSGTPLAPKTTEYDVKGTKVSSTTGASITNQLPLSSTPAGKDNKWVKANSFYTDYFYVQEGTNSEYINGNGTGEIYTGIDASKFAFYFTSITFAPNKSYTIVLKQVPLLYLFQDGSNGILAEKGSRTPIGLVTVEKTNTREGTAAALTTSHADPAIVAQNGHKWEDLVAAGVADGKRNTVVHANANGYMTNPRSPSSLDETNGYDLTWSAAPTVTTDGKVRATEATQYPAFYWAGHFHPGVSTSNIGKWYIPAFGEIFNLYMRLFTDGGGGMSVDEWGRSGSPSNHDWTVSWQPANSVIKMLDALQGLPENVYLWTSSTAAEKPAYSTMDDYSPIAVEFSRTPFSGSLNGERFGAKALKKDAPNVYVWPWVHF
ncbi:hypothetical protein J5A66_04725 [Prevotella sp. oral taxon 475]|uniref:hypothetical protein n=1 Tax=Prevotella sp. oral taxon 475 TaxID=712471 RepID=UPI001BACCB31|nr:hypothetical protein [Prevotella sp. oral taxon 475]QUB48079.1 hypothetical protein J5A66_04725 [Prevotella sp. oral taxon 475]